MPISHFRNKLIFILFLCSNSCSLHLTYIYLPQWTWTRNISCRFAFLSRIILQSFKSVLCWSDLWLVGRKSSWRLEFSPRFVDALRIAHTEGRVHHSGDHQCNPGACIILRVLCLLTCILQKWKQFKSLQESAQNAKKTPTNWSIYRNKLYLQTLTF